ncbi:hypothetical protein [Fulvivirga sp.]|uniref:hypothetical protein n=1 Tax=Fulvivirga sp. TaxID=1931237 RepID=UPI0032EB71FE
MSETTMTRYEAADWLFDIIIERGYRPTDICGFLKQKKGISDSQFQKEVSDVLLRSTLVEEWGNDPKWFQLCANIEGIEAKESYDSLSEYVYRNKANEYTEKERLEFIQNVDNSITITNSGDFKAHDLSSNLDQSRPTITPTAATPQSNKKTFISELFSVTSITDIIKGVFIGLLLVIILYFIFLETGIRLF